MLGWSQEQPGPDGVQAWDRNMAFVTLFIGLQILWAGILGLIKTRSCNWVRAGFDGLDPGLPLTQ